MRFLLCGMLLLFTNFSYAKEKEYTCEFSWKTLSENPPPKAVTLQQALNYKVSETLSASLKIDKLTSSLKLKEVYKDDNKNFNEYNFSCNTSLSCHGSSVKMFNRKKENEKITIEPSGTFSIGKAGERELFQYKLIPGGFSYDYIIYRNEKNELMGLKVVCKK